MHILKQLRVPEEHRSVFFSTPSSERSQWHKSFGKQFGNAHKNGIMEPSVTNFGELIPQRAAHTQDDEWTK